MKLKPVSLYLLQPKCLIFAGSLVNFVVSAIYVRQAELERRAWIAAYPGHYHGHWYPTAEMVEPLLLVAAAVALLINQWWSLLLAMLAAGRVVYLLGYLSWRAVHFAHDVPMLSWQAVEKLWYVVYQPRRQYLVQVIFAGTVFVYTILLGSRFVYSRYAEPGADG